MAWLVQFLQIHSCAWLRNEEFSESYLLGDGGYAGQRFLLTH